MQYRAEVQFPWASTAFRKSNNRPSFPSTIDDGFYVSAIKVCSNHDSWTMDDPTHIAKCLQNLGVSPG